MPDDNRVPSANSKRPLLFLVEGVYDIEFLTALSSQLQAAHLDVPDLVALGTAKELLFIPTGGGSPKLWMHRFEPLGCRELHLYDREQGEEEQLRYECAEIVNQRPGCRAFVTEKRSLENYLHPTAIAAAGGGDFRYEASDHLGACVAQEWYARTLQATPWPQLTPRARSRYIQRAKKWLNTVAVQHMTAELLYEQDPKGDLLRLFRAVNELLAYRLRNQTPGESPAPPENADDNSKPAIPPTGSPAAGKRKKQATETEETCTS